MEPKFALGRVVATAGVTRRIELDPDFGDFVNESMGRHMKGDWGDLGDEDKATNDAALNHDGRVMSAYDGTLKIWIITEHDRSVTTILLPSEY